MTPKERAEKIRNWLNNKWRPTYPDEAQGEIDYIADQITDSRNGARQMIEIDNTVYRIEIYDLVKNVVDAERWCMCDQLLAQMVGWA